MSTTVCCRLQGLGPPDKRCCRSQKDRHTVWPHHRAKFQSECHYAIRVSNVVDRFGKRSIGRVKPVRCARNAKIRLVEIRGMVLMHRVQYFGGAFDVTTMFDTQLPKYRMPRWNVIGATFQRYCMPVCCASDCWCVVVCDHPRFNRSKCEKRRS